MRKKRISIIALVKILGLIILALVHIYSIIIYINMPRCHTSPVDFPNSVWECEYNGAKITLFVKESADVRGYIDKSGEYTYLAASYDPYAQSMSFYVITKERFYVGTQVLAHKDRMLYGHFRCTDTSFIIKKGTPIDWATDFWQTEGPIELVFYRVID